MLIFYVIFTVLKL